MPQNHFEQFFRFFATSKLYATLTAAIPKASSEVIKIFYGALLN